MAFTARLRCSYLFSLMVLMTVLFLFVLSMPAHAQSIEWSRDIGTNLDDELTAVAASPSAIYVTGDTRGTFPGQSCVGTNDHDGFLGAYDKLGNQVWIRQFGSANGGGYTTQFILFSGTTGQTFTGNLRFSQQSGAPLGVTVR